MAASDSGEPSGSLSPEDREFLNTLAVWLGERRMTVPAVLFLESVKPLSFLGSQAMFFLEPMVKAFFDAKNYSRFAALMENRDNVEELTRLIERAEQDLRDARKKEKQP